MWSRPRLRLEAWALERDESRKVVVCSVWELPQVKLASNARNHIVQEDEFLSSSDWEMAKSLSRGRRAHDLRVDY